MKCAPIKKCEICTSEFYPKRPYRARTCSKACKTKLISRALTGRREYNWTGELTAELARELFSYNPITGELKRSRTSRSGQTSSDKNETQDGYRVIRVNYRLHREHRLIWLIYYGEWPSGMVDHINRNRQDNRIANLRLADPAGNSRNAGLRSDNKSGYKGVFWNKDTRKWRASIRCNGRTIYIGEYDNIESARSAYDRSSRSFHGEFGATNSEVLSVS